MPQGTVVRNVTSRAIATVFCSYQDSAWVTVKVGDRFEDWLICELEVQG